MRIVCGNSNVRDVDEEEAAMGRSHRCSIDDPCTCCLIRWGKIKIKELTENTGKTKQ